jgi:diguanylate cyclase (GGDEF)-like protein
MKVHLRQVLIILIVILSSVEIPLLKLPVLNTVALLFLVLLLAAIHWDLTDGGLISRALYYFSPSFRFRNLITVGTAALMVLLLLYFSKLVMPPYLALFYFPLILSAVRGGATLTFSLSIAGPVALALLMAASPVAPLREGLLQLGLLSLAGVVTAVLVDRMHRLNLSLGTLFESGSLIGSTLRIDHVLSQIIEIVRSELAADSCALMLTDKDGNVSVKAAHGLEKTDRQERANAGEAVSWVLAHNQSLFVADLRQDSKMTLLQAGERSFIAAPLTSQGRVVGVLTAAKKKPNGFSYHNLRFLEGLALQANLAIGNAYLYKETEESAIRDGLTGLYNYRFFSQQLASELTGTEKRSKYLSLIILDIDHFKHINDRHGHLRGDDILKGVSRLLRNRTREGDLVARYGGEEFVILLPGTKYEDALAVASQLRQLLEKAVFRGRKRDVRPIRLTVSLGLSTYPLTASGKEQLLQQADESLYEAKLYRNAVCSPFECILEGPVNKSKKRKPQMFARKKPRE